MPASVADVEGRLWDIADSLRANSGLRASEYSTPVLGLIFLRFADHRFADAEKELVGTATGRRTIGKLDFQARGAVYLPDNARFSALLELPEGENIGRAIDDAMRAIGAQILEMKAAGIGIERGEVRAYREGPVAWASGKAAFKPADGPGVPIRITAVLTGDGSVWKLVQWHSSVGVANEEIVGEALAVACHLHAIYPDSPRTDLAFNRWSNLVREWGESDRRGRAGGAL